MKIVLDTNVIVSGIFWTGAPFKILEFWIQDRFELLITKDILKEYESTLLRISKGKTEQLVSHWLILIAENSHVIRIKRRFKLSKDPDDDKFIECAVAGNATYIVSGDAHLLDIGMVMDIPIITPSEFIRRTGK